MYSGANILSFASLVNLLQDLLACISTFTQLHVSSPFFYIYYLNWFSFTESGIVRIVPFSISAVPPSKPSWYARCHLVNIFFTHCQWSNLQSSKQSSALQDELELILPHSISGVGEVHFSAVRFCTIQCSGVGLNTIQYSAAVQCSAVQCSAVQCS